MLSQSWRPLTKRRRPPQKPRCERPRAAVEGWDACPSWTAVARGLRPTWRRATRLAASCVAHSHLLLPRPRDAAVVDAGLPSPASLPVRPARWRVADGHTRRAGHDVVPDTVMQVALRRRLRLPLPITTRQCGSPGCGGSVDATTTPWRARARGC